MHARADRASRGRRSGSCPREPGGPARSRSPCADGNRLSVLLVGLLGLLRGLEERRFVCVTELGVHAAAEAEVVVRVALAAHHPRHVPVGRAPPAVVLVWRNGIPVWILLDEVE